ncbi:hypothetical protein GLAREA_04747 [Glarea lozoyensis ATCC 20868]|uniref:Heterokaryon incompatibility domain-containing protein n=1 Tax=Glarea lozoyensis (strain ATCC 20868 / MF5171) TaxID=1116229 RepID=S3D7H0_GLAL2|nr:uncharacterized protein GLAREA_04747 [Glarea lozoyensis ATCC 20868]EPE27956.1 hypothetical protein GLAREA_04747 [Glarea lozoyensis ATCC 20868]
MNFPAAWKTLSYGTATNGIALIQFAYLQTYIGQDASYHSKGMIRVPMQTTSLFYTSCAKSAENFDLGSMKHRREEGIGSSVSHVFSEESSEMLVVTLENNYDPPYGDEWAFNLRVKPNGIEADGPDELSGSSAPLAPLSTARLDTDRMFELHVNNYPVEYLLSSPTSNSTASTESREWARHKLKECLSNHGTCTLLRRDPNFMPTRLLDVSSVNTDGIVRLTYPTSQWPKPRYLTLSYCWGGDQKFKLTHATYDELQVGISVARLQKSIQDAIRITNWFDVQYIWVDSLCIIQDEPDDWDHESKQMCEVYQNSTLTISAQGAKSSEQGCFASRNPLMHLPCKLTEADSNGNAVTVFPQKSTAWWRKQAFEQAPLFKRAWVIQERMLSPRNLCFGEILTWECNQVSTSEFDEFLGLRNPNPKALLPVVPHVKGELHSEKPVFSIFEFWSDLMRSYPASGITVNSDRPVAVRGIIQYLEEVTDYMNMHGLWIQFLNFEILWLVEKPSKLQRLQVNDVRARKNQSPSWSWLEMAVPVTNTYDKTKELEFICRVAVLSPLSEMPPFKTKLHVRGFVLRATIFTSKKQQFDGFLKFHKVKFLPDYADLSLEREILFLLVARDSRENWGFNMAFYYGLAICPSAEVKGAYERIGYLKGGVPLFKDALEDRLKERDIFLV